MFPPTTTLYASDSLLRFTKGRKESEICGRVLLRRATKLTDFATYEDVERHLAMGTIDKELRPYLLVILNRIERRPSYTGVWTLFHDAQRWRLEKIKIPRPTKKLTPLELKEFERSTCVLFSENTRILLAKKNLVIA